jgi:hypothetical protein
MPPVQGPFGAPRASWMTGRGGKPWIVLVLILLVGVGTAAAIGLSGPSVEAGASPHPLEPAASAGTTP